MRSNAKDSRRAATRIALWLSIAVAGLAGHAAAADEGEPNPIVTQVKTSVQDLAKPFTLGVILKANAGEGPKVEAAFAKAIKTFRGEKGCAIYELNRAADSETTYVVYERWQDVASLEAHVKGEAFKTLAADLGNDLLEGPPEIKVLVPVPVGQ